MSQLRVSSVTDLSGAGSTYAPGHVVQVVPVENTTRTAQGISANTITNVSGLEATITPKSVNSKIVIQARWFGEMAPNHMMWDHMFGVSRNGVQIGRQTDGIGSTVINGITTATLSYFVDNADSTPESMSLFISDSPGTTSPVTYRITIVCQVNGTLHTNKTVGWNGQSINWEIGTSSMMLMEIAQ